MTNGVHLIGGGRDPAAAGELYGPFLAEAGDCPRIAVVILDEGDGREQFDVWAASWQAMKDCRPFPVLVPLGGVLDVGALGVADGLFVSGGLTPAYAAALTPVAAELSDWLANRPYCGFSAGAVVAAATAVTGGWLIDGRPLIPDDAAEDLDQVTVGAGLGLIPLLVDVHAGQWGTLPRLLAAVAGAGVPGVAIDENTALHAVAGMATVSGSGHIHLALPARATAVGARSATVGDGVLVRRFAPGARFSIPRW